MFQIELTILLTLLIALSELYRNHPPYSANPGQRVVNYRQIEKKILDKILSPEIYDSQIRENEICSLAVKK